MWLWTGKRKGKKKGGRERERKREREKERERCMKGEQRTIDFMLIYMYVFSLFSLARTLHPVLPIP